MKPLVSVVIPTYNREKFIKNTIESVLKQTYQNFEIIVIDDGSTDNTKDVVASIKDKRIKYIYQENNGAQVARNNGIKHSAAEYIAFLDSDDEWIKDKLEKQVQILKKNNYNKNLVIHSSMISMDSKGKSSIIKKNALRGKNMYKVALEGNSAFFPTIFCSKHALFEVGLCDENVSAYQEWDLVIQLAKICEFIYIDEPLSIYNLHDADSISKSNTKAFNGFLYIIDKYRDDIIKLLGKNVYNNHIEYLYSKAILTKNLCKIAKAFSRFTLSVQLKKIYNVFYKKEKYKNKRTITILGFIKLKYKKENDIAFDKKTDFPSMFPIALSQSEKDFLIKHMNLSDKYLEFGAGGSTFLAILHSNIKNIVSVDSDEKWLNHLREWKVIKSAENEKLRFESIDIGKTGYWGVPTDCNSINKFPDYSSKVFDKKYFNNDYDLVFIDGRFRVACLLQTILNCKNDTIILMHDFNNRPYYHSILKYVDIVDTAETMASFKIKKTLNKQEILDDYEKYKTIFE